MVGAAVGLGGKVIRTVSFFGWTLPVSFFGGTAPPGKFGMFSAIRKAEPEPKPPLRPCQTRNRNRNKNLGSSRTGLCPLPS